MMESIIQPYFPASLPKIIPSETICLFSFKTYALGKKEQLFYKIFNNSRPYFVRGCDYTALEALQHRYNYLTSNLVWTSVVVTSERTLWKVK